MAKKGYSSYRGRRSGVARFLPVIVLILILLAACGFMLAQEHIIYSDDGSIRLDLPFMNREEPEEDNKEQTQPGNQLDQVIDQPQTEQDTQVAAPAEDPYGEHRLVELKSLPADGDALVRQLEEAGANGFVYTVRDNTGQVFLDSAASIRSASKGAAGTGAKLSLLCQQEGVVSVARLNCFHDSYFAWVNMEGAGVCQSGGHIWYDDLSYHWIDPAKELTRQYVIGLALECAQLGFDELLLEEMCYPSSGKLERIDYSGNGVGKEEALELFLQELRLALEPYDVKVTLLLDGRLLSGEDQTAYRSASGQDLQRLLPYADAVYARVEDVDAARRVLAEGTDGMEDFELIPILTEAISDGNWYISQN